jgi:hypothetical protein
VEYHSHAKVLQLRCHLTATCQYKMVNQWVLKMRLSIEVWLELYNTLLLHDWISLFQSVRFASSFIHQPRLISQQLNRFFDFSSTPFTSVFTFIALRLLWSMPSPMWIGLRVLMIGSLHEVLLCFLDLISSCGVLRNKRRSLA